MLGISDALDSSANNLRSLGRSLALIQKNVGSASTPGYARQDPGATLDSLSSAEAVGQISSRDEFAEAAVRGQNSQLGQFDQLSTILSSIETGFGASGDAEIPKSITNLFSTFSALTTTPNDAASRQQVLDRAAQLAGALNSASASLSSSVADTRQQVAGFVEKINHLAGLVRNFNAAQAGAGGVTDPSVDAKLHETLEQLSEYANVQTLRQTDGSLTLLLGGRIALVVGGVQYKIQADTTSSPSVAIRDSNGADITSQTSGGRLAGGLQAVNQLLPSYQDGLNQLAKGIADSVNAALASGIDAAGNPGAPLFSYGSAANAPATLAVTGITTAQLAAAAPGAPGGNGNALALAGLEASKALNGYTFAGFYGNLAAGLGRDVTEATDNKDVRTQLVAQARAARAAVSGVSLDQEAVRLIEFQRAYEATARLITILDELSQETVNMIRG